jgi:hypothetical protein
LIFIQLSPQARFDPLTQSRHKAFKQTGTWQQYPLREHPRRGPIKQDAGPLGAGPALRIQPARQSKSGERMSEPPVAVVRTNLLRMRPALFGL